MDMFPGPGPWEGDDLSPRNDDEDHEVFEDDDDLGGDSGNESDPIERYLDITRWQKRLRSVQRKLHQVKQEIAAGTSPHGEGEGHTARRRRMSAASVAKQLSKGPTAVARKLSEGPTAVAKQLREGPKKVVGTVREQQKIFQRQYKEQMSELKGRLDKSLSRVRTSKARQLRHMVCFMCSMCDLVLTSVWLGASPWTLHWYNTFKLVGLIGVRAVWYRFHGSHYLLFDLCYFSNLVLLTYVWVLPGSEMLFEAAYGLSGVLLLSVPVFRNSFVPHSLDRVTSVQVHLGPALQMWALRWYADGRPVWWSERCLADAFLPTTGPCVFRIPREISVWPGLYLYFVWLLGYSVNQFVVNRKTIERMGYETLYTYMAYDVGILKMLPKSLQGPIASRAVFVAGHFLLFCSGLPCVRAPFLLHTIFLCAATAWCFKNGATFYITYFWRVYETQIHAFERQMAQASAGAAANGEVPQSPPDPPGTPISDCAMELREDVDPADI